MPLFQGNLVDAQRTHPGQEIVLREVAPDAFVEDARDGLPAQIFLGDHVLEFDPDAVLVDKVLVATGHLRVGLGQLEALIEEAVTVGAEELARGHMQRHTARGDG